MIVYLLTGLIVMAALTTCIPYANAKKKCDLGYKALCPFAPMSTITLLVAAGVVFLIGSFI
ncbi:MAG: hypothetical protein K8I82_10205 [Anaerolineae bacterium]|nr:hypothetical protein [Anaerolineae bacterium]